MTKPQLQLGTPGRNDACPCGSNKKYKKCCGSAAAAPAIPQPLPAANANLATIAWQMAVRYFEANDLAQAQLSCDQALAFDPTQADALQLRAMIAARQQDYATALHYIERALQQAPHSSLFYNALGTIYADAGQPSEAEQAYLKAVQLDANNAAAWHNLADCQHTQNRFEEALLGYREALRCQPDLPEAHNGLGQLLICQKEYAQAFSHLMRAIELRPDYFKAHCNLAEVLRFQNRPADMQTVLERATVLNPSSAEAWYNLGWSLQKQGKAAEALGAYQKAVELKPDLTLGYVSMGRIQYEQGLVDLALQNFARVQAIRPSSAMQLKMALSFPALYDSVEQIQAERERLAADIDRLLAADLQIESPYTEIGIVPFYLGYQGENEVGNLSRIGDLILKSCPKIGAVAPHCLTPKRNPGPLKIGFISSGFTHPNHIVTRVMSGILTHWPREQFQLTVLHQQMPSLQIVSALHDGDRLVSIPHEIDAAREKIAAEEFDILFYADLGLEPWTYFLAFSRLARIQLTCGGHPITSGVPNMDYFLSSTIDEVPHAQEHYRERLILPPHRTVWYAPNPPPTQRRTRAELGLPENKRIYLCPMTPFKFHPEMDQLIGDILRTDGEGEVAFVVNSQSELWGRLKQRMQRAMPDVADRLRFLPFFSSSDFSELLRLSDVLLDTTKFNGGTTSLEALAVGTPIVTLPGELLRQRCTYAMYNAMGWYDCVVKDKAEYVQLATEIARRPDYREHLKQEILVRNDVLYNQTNWIKPLAYFLLEAAAQL